MTTIQQQSGSIFEHLRVLEFEEGERRHEFVQTNIFCDYPCSIAIFTAEIKPGKWAWGYNVFTKDCKNLYLNPSLEYGHCRSERDAKLYVLGFLLANGSIFTQDAREAIGSAIRNLQQLSLF